MVQSESWPRFVVDLQSSHCLTALSEDLLIHYSDLLALMPYLCSRLSPFFERHTIQGHRRPCSGFNRIFNQPDLNRARCD